MGEWDATSYEGKDTILRVLSTEADRLFTLAEPAQAWPAPTACTGWAARDVVGHLVDTTEAYFVSFDAARGAGEAPAAYGLTGMKARVDEQATAFRNVGQQELMGRLRADFAKMMGILKRLGPDEWTGLMVPHFYMGPLPAFFYAAFQLMDYTVHSWDIRQGSGRAHAISADAADLLAPFMFVLWQATVRAGADLTPMQLGLRVGGRNAGDYRITVNEKGMAYERGTLAGLPTVLEFDPGSLVLTAFGRSNAGSVRGDTATADRFLNQFFRI